MAIFIPFFRPRLSGSYRTWLYNIGSGMMTKAIAAFLAVLALIIPAQAADLPYGKWLTLKGDGRKIRK